MNTPCCHCGSPVPAEAADPAFCCAGCKFVFGLIHERGLEGFYRMRSEANAAPQSSVVFHARDYRWLTGLMHAAESDGNAAGGEDTPAGMTLEIQGISCAGCVWLIEKVFHAYPGALSARIDSTAGRVDLRWESGRCDVAGFAAEMQRFGYLLGPPGAESTPPMRALSIRLGVTGALAMNTMLFSLPAYLGMEKESPFAPLFATLCFVLASASLVVGGGYFVRRSWHSLRAGYLHMDLPIALGLLAAYAGSVVAWRRDAEHFMYFDFVAVFAFLMLGGRWMQQRAVLANRNQLLRMGMRPAPVLLEDGERVEVELLQRDSVYLLSPGAHVPVRSVLLSDKAALGLGWINGEPEPRTFPEGGIIPAGALNVSRESLRLRGLETWENSQLARLLRMETRPEARNSTMEHIIRVYLMVVLGLGAAGFAGWWWGSGEILTALQVLVSVLVVSCPCAAGVAIPLAEEMVVAGLRRRGVYVRVHDLWQRLARVRKIIFDKTGTLTLEMVVLQNRKELEMLSAVDQANLLVMVGESMHPVAACLREELLATGVRATDAAGEVAEETGFGIEWRTDGRTYRLGRSGWADSGVMETGSDAADAVFASGGNVLARFQFSEELRPDAASQVKAVLAAGRAVYLLSGDRPEKVAHMAGVLGVPNGNALGGLSPTEKSDWVRTHAAGDGMMIGDGANDSLAFDQALCRGTPAVDRGLLEQKADFYFTGRSLSGLGQLFDAAKARGKAVRAVFLFAACYNIGAVSSSLAGWMNPLVAAVIMPLSSLISIGLVWGILNAAEARMQSPGDTKFHGRKA